MESRPGGAMDVFGGLFQGLVLECNPKDYIGDIAPHHLDTEIQIPSGCP